MYFCVNLLTFCDTFVIKFLMKEYKKVIVQIESSRGSGRQLIEGVVKYARLHGNLVFYRQPGGLESAIPKIESIKADGIIARDVKGIEKIIKMRLPAVIDVHFHNRSGVTNIVTRSLKIGFMAAEHFLSCGLRNFAFCGFDNCQWSVARGRGFEQRLKKEDFNVYHYLQPKSQRNRIWYNEQKFIIKWLQSLPKPIGIMACNDDRGQNVIEACKIAGIDIPQDAAVIGVDNDPLQCSLIDPPLSSIAMDFEGAGYEAAAVLDKMIEGKKAKKTIYVEPLHIATRQSTDVAAVDDEQVAQAIRFIRKNARENIRVNDVSDFACLSRRSLERRFKSCLNSSVLKEIKNTRTELIKKMLLETNFSILQIAKNLNYSGVDSLVRSFRNQTGTTPLSYRKKHLSP